MTAHTTTVPLRAARYVLFFRFAAFLPIGLGCIFLLYFLPTASSIVVLTATVQSMSFKVVVSDMARLPLAGYALSYEAAATDLPFGSEKVVKSKTSAKPVCLEGLFTPTPGTQITYERFGAEPVAIEVRREDGQPLGRFEITKGSAPEAIQKSSWLRLVAPKASSDSDDSSKDTPVCTKTPTTMLPVYGLADVGSEIRPLGSGERQSYGTLLDGTLDIFARTIPLPFLQIKQRVYPASTSSITIPPGSRVTIGGDDKRRKPWAGFVMPDAANSFGLDVRLTSEAKEIEIIRPGTGLDPETLSVGLFTQLTNDPYLMAAQVIVALLFSVFEMLGSILSWISTRRSEVTVPVLAKSHADRG